MMLLMLFMAYQMVAAYPLIPDPNLTPGAVASTDDQEVCGVQDGLSYSKNHRLDHTLKNKSIRLYGIEGFRGEGDHRVPLSLGGADKVSNMWPQVYEGPCGAKAKDVVEDRLWRQVCKEHSMSLSDAQAVFMGPYWKKLPGCVVED